MKFSRALALLLGLLLVAASCRQPPPPQFQGGPRLSVEPAAIDFGSVPAGTTVKSQFTLSNIGDAPLAIEKAITRVVEGCCPPQPTLNQNRITPGKKATLSLEFTMVAEMEGPHRFEVLVYSNDAVAPVMTLEVKGVYLSQ